MLCSPQPVQPATTALLFQSPPVHFSLPTLPEYPLEDMYDQMELLGFPLQHPFQLVAEDPASFFSAADMPQYKGQNIQMLGYLIT